MDCKVSRWKSEAGTCEGKEWRGWDENEGKTEKGGRGEEEKVASLERLAIVSVELSSSWFSLVPWALLGASWPTGVSQSQAPSAWRTGPPGSICALSFGGSTELCRLYFDSPEILMDGINLGLYAVYRLDRFRSQTQTSVNVSRQKR